MRLEVGQIAHDAVLWYQPDCREYKFVLSATLLGCNMSRHGKGYIEACTAVACCLMVCCRSENILSMDVYCLNC